MGGVGGEAEEKLVEKSRRYVDSMTCASVRMQVCQERRNIGTRITEIEGVRRPFGSLVNVKKGKP